MKDLLQKLIDYFEDKEFVDFFPINDTFNDTKNLLIITGKYLVAIIVGIVLWALLGGIFILGVIIKILASVVIIYSIVGMVGALLNYMKYH